jgi:uncharacterized protein involved in exopolysaccharide biosynthesis
MLDLRIWEDSQAMEDEIDLRGAFLILWRGRFLIVGITLVAIMAAGVISYAMPPVYKASCIIALGNFGDAVYTSQDSAMAVMLSDEYLLDVIDELSFDVPPKKFWEFKRSIYIEPVKGSSNLIVISAKTNIRQEGVEIVKTIVWHFINISEESYDKHNRVLSGNLVSIRDRLESFEKDASQTRETTLSMTNVAVSSYAENETAMFRALDILNSVESRRSSLLDREMDLQNQLTLLSHLDVIQGAREPVSPMESERILILTIAGILGFFISVLAVFLKDSLKMQVELPFYRRR